MNLLLKSSLFICMVVLLASCKKDDDISSGNLVGTWRMTDISCTDGESTATLLGIPVSSTFTYEGIEYNTTTTFTENPNQFTSSGSYKFRVETNTLGQIETSEETVSFNGGTGTWELDGDILYQTFADTTIEIKLLELSDDVMRTEQSLDATIMDSDLGFTITTSGTLHTRFEKE